jgi:polar amino acid transport system permease protein
VDVQLLARIAPFIAEAALVTVELTALSALLGLAVSALIVVARFARVAPVRWAATAYVSVIRGTPLLVQLFLVFFGGPQFGLDLSPFAAGILTMGFNIGAYMSEGIRGAILSVERGQTEAARSLGFGRLQTMQLFILPQAAPLMIHALGVNTIILSKGTALVSTIGVVELTYSAQRIVTSTYKPFEVFALAGATYILIIAVVSLLMRLVEAMFGPSRRAPA